jgi:hypothetical protein
MSTFEETKKHHEKQYDNFNFTFIDEFFNTPLVKEFLSNSYLVSDPKNTKIKKVNSNGSSH